MVFAGNAAKSATVLGCREIAASIFSPALADGDGLLEPEFEQRFARDLDLLAAREDLHARAGRGTRACADRRASAAAGDCADDRAERRAAADFLSGVRCRGPCPSACSRCSRRDNPGR